MIFRYTAGEHNLKPVVDTLDPFLRVGQVICLKGPLGAGKTTLVRACLEHLVGSPVDVVSPTFTLCQQYDTPRGLVYHYDLYRLEQPEELEELGLIDFLSESISFIEWPEVAEAFLPTAKITITIGMADNNQRTFVIAS